MSDTGDNAGQAAGSAPQFTEREMQMLAWAMQSLKSGPPDIDYEKLAGFAGMSNPRSASNAWAKIRTKLNAAAPTDGSAPAVTPKKGGAKKKGAAKEEKGGDATGAVAETPKKTPRKRTTKKQEVDGETSPKKKGRTAKAKKGSDDEMTDVNVEAKAEGPDDSDLQPNGESKADAAAGAADEEEV